MFNHDEIYCISDFLSLCNKTVEDNIPTCWIRGELSNLARPASGHWYFSLKDNKGQIRCALFRLNQRGIKFNPENGMEVLVRAAPTLYEARGDFQLIIQHIEPVGDGNLNLAFEQLKDKLSKEGLFDSRHKQPLPTIVNTIGVVSSSTGAVIQDIIKVLKKRYPFADVLLFDSVVQGESAETQLIKALTAADQYSCDVLILARGGGSLEDIWAFNEEALARVIFNLKTPIISAIGHETDTTIADFVADMRAPTPSAAAMLATPDKLELLSRVNHYIKQLSQSALSNLSYQQNKINSIKLRLRLPDRKIHLYAQKIDHLQHRLFVNSANHINNKKIALQSLTSALKQHSPKENVRLATTLNKVAYAQLKQQMINSKKVNHMTLNTLHERLKKSIMSLLEKHKGGFQIHTQSLNHLSPLNTLSRGFSITSSEQKGIISSVKSIQKSQNIITRLNDGVIYSKVEKIEKI